MKPLYSIDVDPERALLTIRLSGFFDADAVLALDAERQAALARLPCGRNRHVALCDVSECKLQAQDIVAAFGRVLANPRFVSERLAFVTGSSLARMQVRRLLTRPDMACFDRIEDAEAWLFAPEPENDHAASIG